MKYEAKKLNLKEKILRALEEKGEWHGKIPIELVVGVSPFNARKHKIEEHIEELENAIGLTGEIREPLTLNQNLQIVKGQRRFLVAKRWNFKEVPVVIRVYKDKLEELLDSRNENMLTFPLCGQDEEDVVYTLAKKWGEERTARRIGKSIAYVSDIVRMREAPEPIKEVFKGQPLRKQRKALTILKDILEKEGPKATLEKGKLIMQLKDHDIDQYGKDYRAGEATDLHARVYKSKHEKEYELFTIRIDKQTSSYLSQIAKALQKDKQELINQILKQWVEEHKGLIS